MISFVRSFFRLVPRDYLPRMRRDIHNAYDVRTLPPAVVDVLALGVAPDPETAARLLEEYQAADAYELLGKLPRPRANWRQRLNNWIVGIEGGYLTDPWPRMRREEMKYDRF